MTKQELKSKAKSASYLPPNGPPTKAGRKILKTFTEDLPVRLSKRELRETGAALAHQWSEFENHEAHKADVKATLKSREESIKAQIASLSMRLNGRTQLKPVACREEADFANGLVESIREDTGEVVRNRPLKTEERQDKMPFVDPDAPDANAFAGTMALPEGAADLGD